MVILSLVSFVGVGASRGILSRLRGKLFSGACNY